MVTSGTFSPSLEKGIGLAFMQKGHAIQQEKVFFGNDKNKNPAMITSRSFYKSASLRLK